MTVLAVHTEDNVLSSAVERLRTLLAQVQDGAFAGAAVEPSLTA